MTFNPPPILNPNRTAHDLAERLPWKNTAGEACPAYGVFRIDSFNETTLHWDAKKPDGEEGLYYVNGPVPVADTKYGGAAMWNLPRRVLVDSDTLAVGDEVGPVDGEWAMSASGVGWRIMRPPETGGVVATVERIGGGSSIVDGLVSTCIGDGWYYVQLAEFTADPASPGEVDPEVGAECDACADIDLGAVVDGISGSCDSVQEVSLTQTLPTGTGEYVYAHITETKKLKTGGHVRMTRIHTGAEGQYYAILSGQYEMVLLPFPMYECCTDPDTGEQSVRMTGCTYVLVEGVMCGGGENPCPE